MNQACTLIEPGIGQWRSARISADEFPETLNFHEDVALSPVDAIFDARVTRVDAALDMAFLDLGGGRTGMLNQRRARLLAKGRADNISDCVSEGMMLRVQVLAEPSALEDKALPVTPRPRLLGRYVAVETGGTRLNFSKDLEPKIVKALTPLMSDTAATAALIVRARAALVPAEAVVAEAAWLAGILNKPARAKPGLVHAFSPLEQALLAVTETEGGLLVEGGDALAKVKALSETRWPDLAGTALLYKDPAPMFEAFGVEEAIEEALAERIELPSGGWISVTETRALTVVDVNMGGALKGRNAGDAKLIVNLEAATALAYHLRFQDIGGLIVVDFIDMTAKGSARDLMDVIDDALKDDDVPVQHTGVSTFGLVEFNRKRRGLSLRQRMTRQVRASERPSAIGLRLLRLADRLGRSNIPGALVLTAPKAAADWLRAEAALVAELAQSTARAITIEDGSTPDVRLS